VNSKVIVFGEISFGKFKPSPYQFSHATHNWQVKLRQIRSKPPKSHKFSSAKFSHYTVLYSTKLWRTNSKLNCDWQKKYIAWQI